MSSLLHQGLHRHQDVLAPFIDYVQRFGVGGYHAIISIISQPFLALLHHRVSSKVIWHGENEPAWKIQKHRQRLYGLCASFSVRGSRTRCQKRGRDLLYAQCLTTARQTFFASTSVFLNGARQLADQGNEVNRDTGARHVFSYLHRTLSA